MPESDARKKAPEPASTENAAVTLPQLPPGVRGGGGGPPPPRYGVWEKNGRCIDF
jgi:hypothetical protein